MTHFHFPQILREIDISLLKEISNSAEFCTQCNDECTNIRGLLFVIDATLLLNFDIRKCRSIIVEYAYEENEVYEDFIDSKRVLFEKEIYKILFSDDEDFVISLRERELSLIHSTILILEGSENKNFSLPLLMLGEVVYLQCFNEYKKWENSHF